MQIKDIIPWARKEEKTPEMRRGSDGLNPIIALQEDLNRAFENFWRNFEAAGMPGPRFASSEFRFPGLRGFGFPLESTAPRADVVETDEGVEVTIELPGLEEKDIEVTLSDDALTVKGEKKVEHEEKLKGYYLSERSYGMFQRTIPLPPGVDTGKAEAVFKNGVLTVKIPTSPEAREKVRRIEVKAA